MAIIIPPRLVAEPGRRESRDGGHNGKKCPAAAPPVSQLDAEWHSDRAADDGPNDHGPHASRLLDIPVTGQGPYVPAGEKARHTHQEAAKKDQKVGTVPAHKCKAMFGMPGAPTCDMGSDG